jgi:hypothetical protein
MLRIIASVDITALSRLHETLVVVDDSINHTISDSLSNDLFSFLNGVETKFLLDISHGDLGVTDVQFLETELEDSVLKSHDQSVVLILLEHFLILGEDLLKGVHIS